MATPVRLRISPDEWRRIGPLLDDVLDTPRDQRAARIAALCAGDVADSALLVRLAAECDERDSRIDIAACEQFPSLFDDDLATRVPAVLAGQYRIEREIGRGGMAYVFLAHDITHDRSVAVKVMRSSVNERLGAKRFLSEIRTSARLRHPHIVPVHDSGDADGTLFFVMPYFDGETLANRLQREPKLALDEAVQIAIDILSALEYAHDIGVVHRDIKPSNILFSSGHAMLSDFGIARILEPTADALTATGVAIGTPGYMSPEQFGPSVHVDARSDVYSLGCVLFEMLAGEPPASASTRLALARHSIDAVPVLVALRPDAPRALEQCVQRAIALAIDNRFAGAAEFAGELRQVALELRYAPEPHIATAVPTVAALAEPVVRTIPRSKARPALVAGTLLLLAIVSIWCVVAWSDARAIRDTAKAVAAADTTRYALLPYAQTPDTGTLAQDADRLRSALQRWQGVSLADDARVSELRTTFPARLNTRDERALALQLRAGRYVRRRVTQQLKQRLLTVTLFDAVGDSLIREVPLLLPDGQYATDSVFAVAADMLLFPDATKDSLLQHAPGTKVRSAEQAFLAGTRAVGEWKLKLADSLFSLAGERDPGFARARIWTAQTRFWRDQSATKWKFEIEHALRVRTTLSPTDQRYLDALNALASDDRPRACALWTALAQDTQDFAGWYGTALCLMNDRIVIPSRTSTSSWQFRSSYHAGVKALQRAFEILPAVHHEFQPSWYRALSSKLQTSPTQLHSGNAFTPQGAPFSAYASWSATGDTLLFIPYPDAQFTSGRPRAVPATRGIAIRRQRALLARIATGLRAAFPKSADAMLALSIALDEVGDPTAVDSLQVARMLAVSSSERVRVGAAEVWMRVKLGVPDDLASLQIARALADSLLRGSSSATADDAGTLASLATIVGQVHRAAQFSRMIAVNDGSTTADIVASSQALLAFAVVGSPVDSIRALERTILAAIAARIEPAQQARARSRWPARSMTLAFPTYQSSNMAQYALDGDPIAGMENDFLSVDTTKVLQGVRASANKRNAGGVEHPKLEVLFPEAWLLRAVGNVSGAIQHLDTELTIQNAASIRSLSDVTGAGVLVRTMILRAQLAELAGDHTSAVRWAKAVVELWRNADAPVQKDVVNSMKALMQ